MDKFRFLGVKKCNELYLDFEFSDDSRGIRRDSECSRKECTMCPLASSIHLLDRMGRKWCTKDIIRTGKLRKFGLNLDDLDIYGGCGVPPNEADLGKLLKSLGA